MIFGYHKEKFCEGMEHVKTGFGYEKKKRNEKYAAKME